MGAVSQTGVGSALAEVVEPRYGLDRVVGRGEAVDATLLEPAIERRDRHPLRLHGVDVREQRERTQVLAQPARHVVVVGLLERVDDQPTLVALQHGTHVGALRRERAERGVGTRQCRESRLFDRAVSVVTLMKPPRAKSSSA